MNPVCKTQMEIIVTYLWKLRIWLPTHELQGVQTDFGFIGSSGEQRVRELARNALCVPEKLRDKVEKKRGGEIGLNPKYEYFRYKRFNDRAAAGERCRRFDAGLPAQEVLAV
jgi:hypothetical protein